MNKKLLIAVIALTTITITAPAYSSTQKDFLEKARKRRRSHQSNLLKLEKLQDKYKDTKLKNRETFPKNNRLSKILQNKPLNNKGLRNFGKTPKFKPANRLEKSSLKQRKFNSVKLRIHSPFKTRNFLRVNSLKNKSLNVNNKRVKTFKVAALNNAFSNLKSVRSKKFPTLQLPTRSNKPIFSNSLNSRKKLSKRSINGFNHSFLKNPHSTKKVFGSKNAPAKKKIKNTKKELTGLDKFSANFSKMFNPNKIKEKYFGEVIKRMKSAFPKKKIAVNAVGKFLK